MKRLSWGAVFFASALGLGAAAANAAPAKIITRPDWAVKPTGDDMERFYPAKAKAENVSGRATIACEITAEGALVDCKAKNESPKGYGFGEAAVSLGGIFQMKPKTVNGEPVGGGTITIPVVFLAPPEQPGIGDMAMVLTRIGTQPAVVAPSVEAADTPKAPVIPCPDGTGMCQGHFFMWLQKPTAKQNKRLVAAAQRSEGTTFAQCTVTTEGLLDGCQFGGDDYTPATEKAMRDAMGLLKAPFKTADGLATASTTVVIMFPWDWLTGKKTEDTP
ncbi:energy transducer TonB [Caulobacter sp. UNC358MFTsu5.1]|uniref:energy transducer TonB n=1 Tax=Caulobacter sp. UNC358MFTsu5.1 TaxID=1449049 RepID=UPI0018CC490A|nr:energy transducer TonB [Caulobacter sp. UNC358MFTsu5.1]